MVRRARLGQYFLGDNAFANPDDYMAFFGDNAEVIKADARRCFAEHGRGIVFFQGPRGPFVSCFYATCQPEDFDAYGPQAAAARSDWEGYDPGTEFLAGVIDPAESFAWFWRCALE
jgi:hypothetical protein